MFSWTSAIGSLVYIGCCVLALRRGEQPERLVATAILLSYAATLFVQDTHNLEATQYGLLVLDVLLLGVIFWSTFSSNRKWTLFAASFQLLAVLLHFAKHMDGTVDGWSYLTAEVIVGYGVTLSLLVGVFLEVRPASLTMHPGDA